ncbi:hypothetical protein P2318_16290 [Myxococcaceae bacterium GXIMD 01537]
MPSPFEAVKKEIAFAYEHVPFIRKHLDAAALRPDDLASPSDLSRLPPTRKADYRKNFPAGVLARGRVLQQPGVYQIRSSGTEGERLVTAARSHHLARRMFGCLSVHPGFDFLKTARNLHSGRFAAPNCSDVECANPHSTMADRLLPDRTLVLPVFHDLLTTPERMLDQAAEELTQHAPQFLYCDSAHLTVLVRHLRAQGRVPHPARAVAVGFSLFTRVNRRQLAAALPAETALAEVVAMSEFGWLALECPQGALHLNTDAYYPEFLVGDRLAEPGELAELVVTSLGDDLSPHIRYRTGDLYRLLSEPCPCGHRFPRVRAEGRASSMLVRDRRVVLTPREVDEVVGDAPWMDLYQLDQTDEDAFVLRFLGNAVQAQEADLHERLQARLGAGARLVLERVTYIPSERSGKLLSCRSTVAARLTQSNELLHG